jgi:1-deoxy-D-xylulose-5-phosphate reductoisomerase
MSAICSFDSETTKKIPSREPLKISIVGATGSIGSSALELARRYPDKIKVVAIAAHSNLEKLIKIADEFSIKKIALLNLLDDSDKKYLELKDKYQLDFGQDAVDNIAALAEADIVLISAVGWRAIFPLLSAIQAEKVIALANKESVVCCGDKISLALIQNKRARIIPVDSEHSSLYQLLLGEAHFSKPKSFQSLILTASGGPFLNKSIQELKDVTPQQAIAHPRWKMGAKISVDSATLFNKALEVIEAAHLFAIDERQIEVIIHPESIIHGMIRLSDGSLTMHASLPDMMLPIAYAFSTLTCERFERAVARLNFEELGRLNFIEVAPERFPSLSLARAALRAGQTRCAIFNISNEVAVNHFLSRKLSFLEIISVVETTLEEYSGLPNTLSLGELIELEEEIWKKVR